MVDTDVFRPRPRDEERGLPILGWIGTHSTWSYVQPLLPLLAEIAKTVGFRFRVVGSGCDSISLQGVEVETLPWRLDREVEDFQSLDVGIYPLPHDSWAAAKSGLKAVQYLAVGVPYVASPVGIVGQIGEAGRTHLEATSPEQWRSALERLLRNPAERREMGQAGRHYAVAHYSLPHFAARMEAILRAAARGNGAEGTA